MKNLYLQCLFKNKCLNCKKGSKIFNGYLSLNENCDSCNFDFKQIRADDGPSYLTILVVGHILAPFIHYYYVSYRPEPLEFAIILCSIGLILSLTLLPIFKRLIYAFMYKNMNK